MFTYSTPVSSAATGLRLHPDRLLAGRPRGARIARRQFYEGVRELPLICPHGHVDPRLLLRERAFRLIRQAFW